MTYLAKVTYAPTTVRVSRPEGDEDVAGAYITLDIDGRTVSGECIPPEGTSLDCWMDLEFAQSIAITTPAIIEAIVDAINDAVSGQNGVIYVEDD